MPVVNDYDLSQVRERLFSFLHLTRVRKLVISDNLPSDESVMKDVLAFKRSSWLSGDSVVFWRSAVSRMRINWEVQCLYAGIERYGLQGLFGVSSVSQQRLLSAVNAELGPDRAFLSLEALERELEKNCIRSTEEDLYSKVTSGVSRCLNFDPTNVQNCIWGVRHGIRSHIEQYSQRNGIAGELVASVEGRRKGLSNSVSLGRASSPMRSLGYPDVEVHVSRSMLSEFIGMNDVTRKLHDALDSIPDKFQDPLMIVSSFNNKRQAEMYFSVLDYPLSDDKGNVVYPTVMMEKPKSVVDKMISGKFSENFVNAKVLLFSENTLNSILHQENNWKYMRVAAGNQRDALYPEYEYVKRLLDKKNGTGISAAYGAGDNTRFLTIAKIAKNHKNPMFLEKYFQIFGHELNPVAQRKEELAKLEALSRSMDAPAVIENKRSFPVSLIPGLSAKQVESLREAGIKTVDDVIQRGFEDVREVAGTNKAMRSMCNWMAENNIFIYPKIDHPKVPTNEQIVLDLQKKVSEITPGEVQFDCMPMRMDGSFVTGSDALHLMAGSILGKTEDCPYFLTAKELHSIGCEPKKDTGIPVFLNGSPEYLYNLADSDFKKVYSRPVYKEICSFCSEHFRHMDVADAGQAMSAALGYYNHYLNNVSGSYLSESFIKHFDDSSVERNKVLIEKPAASIRHFISDKLVESACRSMKIRKMYENLSIANSSVSLKKK